MLIEKGKVSDLPKRPRKRTSVPRFAKTIAWKKLKAELDSGIGINVEVRVILTPEDMDAYRIKSRRSITRFIQSYIKERGLRHHSVVGYGVPDGHLIAVRHVPVVRKTA